jgi:hypothetical protein
MPFAKAEAVSIGFIAAEATPARSSAPEEGIFRASLGRYSDMGMST